MKPDKIFLNGKTIKNRKKFFSKVKIKLDEVVWARVAQGLKIVSVDIKQAGKTINSTDGLITNAKGITLAITMADCLPIYFYDPIKQVIGLAHAGWHGVLKNFPVILIKRMAEKYKLDIKQIKVFVGPHIKFCHFEVKNDVAIKFSNYSEHLISRNGKIFIDLSGIVKKQLIKAGLKPENFKIFGGCTYCGKNYFSFRREKGKIVKAMAAFIVMK